jgi:homoserine O-acetyltransferase/O-succinyltransferase
MKKLLALMLAFFSAVPCLQAQQNMLRQQYASIGDLPLLSGETISDCRIGYRTYGKLNATKSNIILFLTWFSGSTIELENSVAGKLIDTASFYLILVDALGDGISSSPSNSPKQPKLSFPVFGIADMVESQYRLLTKNLDIHHVLAIGGISMGGMQSFQWAVSHPDFADKIIPIVGSPQLTSNDLMLWTGELNALQADTAYHQGNYTGLPTIESVSVMHRLAVATPAYYANNIPRKQFDSFFMKAAAPQGFDWNNWHRQLQAMIGLDIAKQEGGSLEKVAQKIKSSMLIVTSAQDHMVNPIPATKMAGLLHAKLIVLQGDCGHLAPGCESPKLFAAVKEFLADLSKTISSHGPLKP